MNKHVAGASSRRRFVQIKNMLVFENKSQLNLYDDTVGGEGNMNRLYNQSRCDSLMAFVALQYNRNRTV